MASKLVPFWVGCVALAAACGGGESDGAGGEGGAGGTGGVPACVAPATECGGDPTGRWKIAGWCGRMATTAHFGDDPACQAQPLDQAFAAVDGAFEYLADGSLTIDIHAEYDLAYTITPACVRSFAEGGVTGDVCAAFQRTFANTPGFTGTACAATPDAGCSCTTTWVDDREVQHRWSLEGGVLHEDDATYTRCVQGDVFWRSPVGLEGDGNWATGVLVRDDPDPALACVDETAECGGDPTGTWELAAACGSLSLEAQIGTSAPCQGQAATYAFDDAEGTLELRADGTLVSALHYDLDLQVEVTPACVADLGGAYGDVCASIAGGYRSAGYADAACTATAEHGCHCVASVEAEDVGTRTWDLDGGVFHDGETAYARCLAGDVFRRSTEHNAGGEGWSTEVFARRAARR